MRIAKWLAIALGAYVAIVAAFETLIGILQPTAGDTLVITTTDEDGTAHDRVLSRIESGGRIYIAANHWPRAWYRRALVNPEVQVALGGETAPYRAVPVSEEEYDRVNGENARGLVFMFLTGFPPREILRLDPS